LINAGYGWYPAVVPGTLIRAFASWLVNNVVWDVSPGADHLSFSRRFWAARKIMLIVAITTILTWREWVEHHPPEIVIVTVLHFIVVFSLITTAVFSLQKLGNVLRSR
jgi:hypothetical protein